ncbi:hypothetical protein EYF80_060627 [Liparis tanakae]|uniref:Uncharacterized protein n=1 Tax=Liparis tanakae TaxID=230148 RepID=A0A4Z2EK44_9TELE|nr:hypothetical protein EYF80_060627 [Liparis tanakae]
MFSWNHRDVQSGGASSHCRAGGTRGRPRHRIHYCERTEEVIIVKVCRGKETTKEGAGRNLSPRTSDLVDKKVC